MWLSMRWSGRPDRDRGRWDGSIVVRASAKTARDYPKPPSPPQADAAHSTWTLLGSSWVWVEMMLERTSGGVVCGDKDSGIFIRRFDGVEGRGLPSGYRLSPFLVRPLLWGSE